MRRNRVLEALQSLGGEATTQDITRVTNAAPECVSSQLSTLARKGLVERAGMQRVTVKRFGGAGSVMATVWRIK